MEIRLLRFAGVLVVSACVLVTSAHAESRRRATATGSHGSRHTRPTGGSRTSRNLTATVGHALARSTDLALFEHRSLTVKRLRVPAAGTISCKIATQGTTLGLGRGSAPRAGLETLTLKLTPDGLAVLDKRSLIATTTKVSCTVTPRSGRPSTSTSIVTTTEP